MVFAYFIGIVFLIVLIGAFFLSEGGCSGNCNQGRTKCDCKNIF